MTWLRCLLAAVVLLAHIVSGGVWTNCGFAGAGCPGGWFRTAICSCQDCSSGRYCPSGGKSYWHRPHCPSGKYQPHSRKSFCYSCPNGKYQPGSGKTYCYSCPSGKYQPSYGRTSCHNCPAGKYQPNTGKTYCHSCPSGKTSHSGAQWSSHCGNCPAGKYAPSSASSSCSNCPSGKYSSSGASACSNCPAGKYASGHASSSCAHCPSGKTTSGHTGRSYCSSCGLGRYYVNAQTACHTCVAGRYQDEAQGDNCKLCLPGKYQPSSASSTCLSCPVGKTSELSASSCQVINPGASNFCTILRPCGVGLGTCAGDHECRQNLKCKSGSGCKYAGSSCCRRRIQKTKFTCGKALPGTEYFSRGYSALVGKPIFEAAAQKSEIFKFSCSANLTYQGYTLYDDVDATFWSRCLSNGRDTSVSSSFTTGTLKVESEGTKVGYDKTWGVTVGASYSGLSGSISTENRLALTFGSSKSTNDGREQSKDSMTRKIESKKQEQWYSAELRYQSVQFTDNFKQATYALAKDFNKEVLGWFATFGGWALFKADMGSMLKRSMFISSTATSTQVDWMQNQVKEYGFAFMGLSASGSKSQTSSTNTFRSNMQKASMSQTQVIGYVPRKFESCGSGLLVKVGTVSPEPIPVRYGLIPLWDPAFPFQDIAGLTWNEVQNVRAKLEAFVVRIQAGGQLCGQTYCNSRGVCVPNPSVYQRGAHFNAAQTNANKYLVFWNHDTCICRSGWRGTRCQTSAVDPLVDDPVIEDEAIVPEVPSETESAETAAADEKIEKVEATETEDEDAAVALNVDGEQAEAEPARTAAQEDSGEADMDTEQQQPDIDGEAVQAGAASVKSAAMREE